MAKSAKKVVKKVAAKAAKAAPKAAMAKPTGMTAELIKMACRPKGATTAELYEHSKWPLGWKWFFANPKKTGVSQRFAYKLKVKHEGRTATYFLTAK